MIIILMIFHYDFDFSSHFSKKWIINIIIIILRNRMFDSPDAQHEKVKILMKKIKKCDRREYFLQFLLQIFIFSTFFQKIDFCIIMEKKMESRKLNPDQ